MVSDVQTARAALLHVMLLLRTAIVVCSPLIHLRCCAPDATPLETLEANALAALEREAILDTRLGTGVGATKERAEILATLELYEEASAREVDSEHMSAFAREQPEEASAQSRRLLHGPNDRVAVFGGDPARRRAAITSWMQAAAFEMRPGLCPLLTSHGALCAALPVARPLRLAT